MTNKNDDWDHLPEGTIRWMARQRFNGDMAAARAAFGLDPATAIKTPWDAESVPFGDILLGQRFRTLDQKVYQRRIVGPDLPNAPVWNAEGQLVTLDLRASDYVVPVAPDPPPED